MSYQRGPDPIPFSRWWRFLPRRREAPRIADDQHRVSGRSVVEGLLGMVPGVGEAMDAYDVGAGVLQRDPSRVATGLLGAALPFVTGRAIRGAAKTADDLPMDEASRMARAREQGYKPNRPMYHGTAGDYAELRASSGGEYGRGVYLTDNPDTAGRFASYAAGREGGESVMPVMTNLQNPMYATKADREAIRATGTRAIRERGHDGIIVSTPQGNEVIVFDPKNIRSRFARFDPNRVDSADLLAGIGGLGLIGAYRSQRER